MACPPWHRPCSTRKSRVRLEFVSSTEVLQRRLQVSYFALHCWQFRRVPGMRHLILARPAGSCTTRW